jgi:hypothetical protein
VIPLSPPRVVSTTTSSADVNNAKRTSACTVQHRVRRSSYTTAAFAPQWANGSIIAAAAPQPS